MYHLHLTESEMKDICFVGYRYGWSNSLAKHCNIGDNDLSELVAWEIREAFDSDTEGNHSMFPMLDSNSELYEKLLKFWESIV
jgi:hypothetical protein